MGRGRDSFAELGCTKKGFLEKGKGANRKRLLRVPCLGKMGLPAGE